MALNKQHTRSQHLPSIGDVPQLPHGFYHAQSPNPTLSAFFTQHATPYNSDTDTYDVSPFSKPLKAKKSNAIYNLHTYWSKKPHDAIGHYIRHYTQPGDIVLDPMCGSGSTALATLMAGRKAVAVDYSPAATFITRNYCTPVSLAVFESAYSRLERSVKDTMEWLYRSACDRCGGSATLVYTVYSQVYECMRCLQPVPLFDCPEVDVITSAGKSGKASVCPHCHAKSLTEIISSRMDTIGFKPVLFGYECNGDLGKPCKPKRSSRHHLTKAKTELKCIQGDYAKLAEIEGRTLPFSPPTVRMLNCPEGAEAWGLLWRPYHKGVETVADFFTKRNLWALLALKDAIERLECDDNVRSFMLGGVTAILHKASRLMGYRDDGVGRVMTGTYWIPQYIKDINVWRYFSEWQQDATRHLNEKNAELRDERLDVVISTQSATDLSKIPSESVDYIFTDPPYSWKVQFGEANFLWEGFLGMNTDWLEGEIIVNEFRGRSEVDWANLMRRVLAECFRVLKPGRWMSLCYHDSSEGTWGVIQDLVAEAGFSSDQSTEVLFIDSDQKSIKQITSDKATKRDLVLNFRKPKPGDARVAHVSIPAGADSKTFREVGHSIIREYLTVHPGTTKDRIYDELVSRMVRRGEMEAHNFDGLLSVIAEEVGEAGVSGRWYLKETADQIDSAEQDKENGAAARLEKFMNKHLAKHPEVEGVHYSDLFEQIISISVEDRPRRLFENWLPEYFFKTPEGTWRPPADEAERQQKAAIREAGTLRRMKRFANALLEGVPVREQDRPDSARTLAEWIRQCRRAGLYEQGRIMYEKGGLDLDRLEEDEQIEVEDDYRICVKRGSEEDSPKKPKGAKKKKQ